MGGLVPAIAIGCLLTGIASFVSSVRVGMAGTSPAMTRLESRIISALGQYTVMPTGRSAATSLLASGIRHEFSAPSQTRTGVDLITDAAFSCQQQRSGDCNALNLYLPGRVGETADDERARRLMCAQHCCAAGSHRGDIGRVAHDRGDLHQILDLHASSAQLCLQIAPSQRGLRLGVGWDAAIGGDAT